MAISEQLRRQLDEEGYVVMPGAVDPVLFREVAARVDELFAVEGDRAGSEFKQEPGADRLANVVNKGEVFQRVVGHPGILKVVACVLGSRFKLSSLNARRARPRSGVAQPLHCDMNGLPDAQGPWVCNCVWMLDAFTPENGPLRAVPGSHRFKARPQERLADPAAPHPDERMVLGEAGTIVVMNAHTWHGGMANRTDRPRTALHAFYCRWDKPQQQYQKQMLDPSVQASMSPRMRELLALDDLLNDDLSGADDVVRSGFMK